MNEPDLIKKFHHAHENAMVVIEKCKSQANDSNEVVCLCLQSAVFILTETLRTVGEDDREKMLSLWNGIVSYVDEEIDYRVGLNEESDNN